MSVLRTNGPLVFFRFAHEYISFARLSVLNGSQFCFGQTKMLFTYICNIKITVTEKMIKLLTEKKENDEAYFVLLGGR